MNEIASIYGDIQYKRAFKEVLVILNYIPESDYKKIPYDIIKTLKDNQEYSYNFSLEPEKSLKEQNVSYLAKAIIENFYRDYWVTNEERKKILQEEKDKRKKIEEEKRKKYNSNNIFKNYNKERKGNSESKTEEKDLIELKEEKWYKKIIIFLKAIFNK